MPRKPKDPPSPSQLPAWATKVVKERLDVTFSGRLPPDPANLLAALRICLWPDRPPDENDVQWATLAIGQAVDQKAPLPEWALGVCAGFWRAETKSYGAFREGRPGRTAPEAGDELDRIARLVVAGYSVGAAAGHLAARKSEDGLDKEEGLDKDAAGEARRLLKLIAQERENDPGRWLGRLQRAVLAAFGQAGGWPNALVTAFCFIAYVWTQSPGKDVLMRKITPRGSSKTKARPYTDWIKAVWASTCLPLPFPREVLETAGDKIATGASFHEVLDEAMAAVFPAASPQAD